MTMTDTFPSLPRAVPATVLAVAIAATAAFAGPGAGGPKLQLPDDTRAWTEKVTPELLARAAATTKDLDVLVKFREPEQVRALAAGGPGVPVRLRWIADTADGLERDWAPAGVKVLDRFSHLASVHLSVPVQALPALAEDQRVDAVALNHRVHKLDAAGRAYMNISAIQPPNSGTGVGIAILDTGVDYTHPELAPVGTKTIALFDAFHTSGDPAYAKDDDGHGTGVAGIAAAAGINSGATGVAPAAIIVSAKVLDSSGNGNDSQILQGINAVLASVGNGNPYNIRVANFSLGGYETGAGAAGVPQQPCDPEGLPLVDAFQQLTNANVMPVVASGNGGCTNGVSWPACISTSLAVGAVYAAPLGTVTYSDAQQCNGSSGCTDVVHTAGGVACFTDSGDKLDVWGPTCATATPLKGGGYDGNYFCGTSASAPYVAGLAALLAQASPSTSAATARLAIRNTGTPITDTRNNITRNLVQADQAVAALSCPPPAAVSVSINKPSVCSGEQAVVSWNAVSGAATYTVQGATDSGFGTVPVSVTSPNSSFSFSTSGPTASTFYFRVRANAPCGASSQWSNTASLTYNPQCSTAYAYTYYLSGIARTPGVAPAFWYSDVSLLNPSPVLTADVQLTFYGVGSFPPAVTTTIGPRQEMTWRDVLNTLFATAQDKGMIVVQSTIPVQALSRTYSQVVNGTTIDTFGQSYMGVPASQALTSVATGYFGGLRSDGAFRTNLEFVNASAVSATVTIGFFTDGGSLITTTTTTVPAYRWIQLVRALPAGSNGAFAVVQVPTNGAMILGSASVIDGNSTDPTTIPMWVP